MLTVTRNVYYCEFCKRHRLTKSAIENHEPRCVYNPDRSACGWHRDRGVTRPADLLDEFLRTGDLNWLHDETDGCPACQLAVVVQARKIGGDEYHDGFVYDDAVKEFRKEEREHDHAGF